VNNILGGTVEVNGSGTLAGVGTIGETVVKSGGTLSPGKYNDTAASTLTVDGNLNMNAGSTLAVNIGANLNSGGIYGESDLVNVLGSANIGGAKVSVNLLAGSYILGTKWNILNATGGVNGTFGDLLQNRPFIGLGYEYDANNAYLVATRTATGYCVDGMSFNQCSVGNNLYGQSADSLINNIIAAQTSIENAKNAFDQLSGEVHVSAKTAALEDSRFLREAMNNRLQETGKTGAWAHAFGSWGDFDGDGNAADMKRDISGVFFGADTALNERWQLGVVGGYSQADIKQNQRKSSADREDYHIGAYTGAKWGQATLRAGVGHTFHKYSTSRNVDIEGLSDHLSADYDANTTQVYTEGSYQAQVGQTNIEPFVNMAYVNHQTDGFTESGGIARLSGGDDRTDMFYSTVGTRVSTNIKLDNNSTLKTWGMLGWRHAYNSVTPDMGLNFQNEGSFTVRGTPIARDAAAIEFGMEAAVTPMVKIGLMYNGQFGDKVSDNGVKAYLNWIF
jgi:outer membrane autotransporter protein